MLAAGPALGQPEPSAADAGKGAPAPRPEEPAPPPPAPDASAAGEAEHGPPAPPQAEQPPPSAPRPEPQAADHAPPGAEQKSKDRRAPQKPPEKPKITGGLVAEAGGGVAGSLLLKGVGTAVAGPVGGFAAGWLGGKVGSGAVHVVRKLLHKDKPSESAPVQQAQVTAPPPAFEPGPLLDVPPSQ
jgi:hypothetical protein